MPLLFAVLNLLVCSAEETILGKGLRFRTFQSIQGFVPVAINDNGDIAGNHPFNGPMLIAADGTATTLDISGTVAAMNNVGQMVINLDGQTFLRDPDGAMNPRTLAGTQRVTGRGLNNLGQMVGDADGNAVCWDAEGVGSVLAVPLIDHSYLTYDRARSPRAHGINDHGDIVGLYVRAPGGGLYGAFRMTADRFFTGVGIDFSGLAIGISNLGDVFFSSLSSINRPRTTLKNSSGGIIYGYSNDQQWFRAVSPDGSRFIGDGFIAESCPTKVTFLSEGIGLHGGALGIRVEADSDCQWTSNYSVNSGSGLSLAWIRPSDSPRVVRVTAAGAEFVMRQGGATCEYSLPGTNIYAPAQGGEFHIPISTADDCAWSVTVQEDWARADPANGFGPGVITLMVSPNLLSTAHSRRLSIGNQPLTVYQPPAGR